MIVTLMYMIIQSLLNFCFISDDADGKILFVKLFFLENHVYNFPLLIHGKYVGVNYAHRYKQT